MEKPTEYKSCGLIELKFAESESGLMSFEGYGAVFGNVDSYGDVIAKGAFADTIAESKESGNWPAMLSQHGGFGLTSEDLTPIGVWTGLSEDDKGLKVTGNLAETPRGKEMYTLMKMSPRPAITGLSIGYRIKEFEKRTKPEDPRRTLKKLSLVEVSPVTNPANGQARVHSVKTIDALDSLSEVEGFLRDAGLSRTEAKHLMAKIKGADLRDAGASEDLARILKHNTHILGVR